MKKRILSSLLALLLVVGMLPLALGASDGSECPVCGLGTCTTDHVYCDICQTYDCGLDHAPANDIPTNEEPTAGTEATPTPTPTAATDTTPEPAPTATADTTPEPTPTAADATPTPAPAATADATPTPAPTPAADYSGDVGKYAALAEAAATSYVFVNTGSFSDEETLGLSYGDFAAELVLKIENWHLDEVGQLWYQVSAHQGALPAAMDGYAWILQIDTTNSDDVNALRFVDLPEPTPDQPEEPAENTCTCGEGDGAAAQEHASTCALRCHWVEEYVTKQTVESLAAQWKTLDKATRETVLALWRESAGEQYAALLAALPDMTHTVSQAAGNAAVTIAGDIPADVTLALAPVAADNYSSALNSYVADLTTLLFALDITPQYADGTSWQPYGGESVDVTVAVPGLEEGARVRLFHEHDGSLSELGVFTVTDGRLTFPMTSFSVVYAARSTAAAQNAVGGVVCFDLSAGNVDITGSHYKGFRFDGQNEALLVEGDLQSGQSYYVYQSDNDKQTGIIDGALILPTHTRVTDWANYIKDNTDVAAVITQWQARAGSAGRSATAHRIAISGAANCTVTVDNVWSSYHQKVTHAYGGATTDDIAGNSTRTRGGISFIPDSAAVSKVKLVFKGDNRFGNIYYTCNSDSAGEMNQNCELRFAGDNDSTLTVGDLRTDFSGKGGGTANAGDNFFCSVIGSDDNTSRENVYGLVFESGHVYAGALKADDCTAIGAGGNGHAQVSITGGTITAVTTSSGTAIGGGIGKGDPGGKAEIHISGGEVYAYNFSCDRRHYGDNGYGVDYILAAAIGGGSSANSTCEESTITISGGSVYARSVGGTAIGGGSTLNKDGGKAKVTISGNAVVDAASVAGTIEYYGSTAARATVAAGVSIGGGTGGVFGNGGDCTLKIEGDPTIYTGSIGGGKTLSSDPEHHIGSATVTITGGMMQGQVIMAKGAATECSFTMTGGTIDNTASLNAVAGEGQSFVSFSRVRDASSPIGNDSYNTYTFLTLNGGAVHVENGTATLSGNGIIQNVKGRFGGAVAVEGGSFSMTGGTIQNGTATQYGGAVYVKETEATSGTATLSGGTIKNFTATYGGAVAVEGGEATLSDMISITGCTAVKTAAAEGGYGGVLAMNNGTVTMTGGAISGFSAAQGGGALYVSGGSATLSGGNITGTEDKTEAPLGGAVYAKGGTVALSGITIEKVGASDKGGAVCVVKDGEKTGTVTMSGGAINNVSAKNGGAVAMTGGSFTMTDGSITAAKAEAVTSGSATDGGNGGAVYVEDGTVRVEGGSITGAETGEEAVNGGGVYITGGSFTMTGGTMSNFKVTGKGGMVCVEGANATATISGGTIKGEAEFAEAQYGGAVYVGQNGTFRINGTGYIKDCNAGKSGGGVYLESGSFTIETNGILENCHAEENGGGLYQGGGTFTATGGSVKNCGAGGDGGGVYLAGGTFTMPGAAIENCTAANGGGVYLGQTGTTVSTLNITGGTIQSCKAQADATKLNGGNGGGIYITGGTCDLTNGTLSGNEAVNGGGVYVNETAVTFGGTGGTVITLSGNKASGDGGGLYINNGAGKTTTITNGTISSNTATGNGGGLYQTGTGSCTVSGAGSIQQNTAKNGGGLYITGGGSLTVDGGHISQNQAVGAQGSGVKTAADSAANVGVGGGVYVAPGVSGTKSQFTLDASKAVGIYDNTAAFAADDLYASATGATVTLPEVANMQLGEGAAATGWYGDYATGDTGSGRLLASTALMRYRDLVAANGNTGGYSVSAGTYDGSYVCLTIGKNNIDFGTLTIKANGAADQYFVYRVESTALDGVLAESEAISFEVAVKGGETTTIVQVPYGRYTVTAVEPWSWRYEADGDAAQAVTVGKSSMAPTANFTYAADADSKYYKDSKQLWLDDNSEAAVNVFGASLSRLAALFAGKGGEG